MRRRHRLSPAVALPSISLGPRRNLQTLARFRPRGDDMPCLLLKFRALHKAAAIFAEGMPENVVPRHLDRLECACTFVAEEVATHERRRHHRRTQT
jgi:hypothetical protein